LGHRESAVLNGGWQQWLKEERRADTAVPVPEAHHFPYREPARDAWLSSEDVLEQVQGRRSGLLMDARAPARFRGDEEPIDPVAGHVPGAMNMPFTANLAEDGRFSAPATLRHRFEAALGKFNPDQAVAMCGSGVTACHNLLAMELAGMKHAKLYAGSWSEWIRDPVRPVARGT
jgi:thiosulfate/3-mercaptopyruvate sulfurtransferase